MREGIVEIRTDQVMGASPSEVEDEIRSQLHVG
jgi:hypothetical protein